MKLLNKDSMTTNVLKFFECGKKLSECFPATNLEKFLKGSGDEYVNALLDQNDDHKVTI